MSVGVILHKNGQPIGRFTVGSDPFIIGRSPEADLVLPEEVISRKHVRLRAEHEKLIAEDLESRNGIIVNGRRVGSCQLCEDDVLSLGQFSLRVDTDDDPQASGIQQTQISASAARRLHDDMSDSMAKKFLPVLYKATQLLRSRFDLEKVLRKLLPLAVKTVRAERGYVMLYESNTETMRVRASSPEKLGEQEPVYSQTLVDYVLLTKSAVLSSNAQVDPRFNKSNSVFAHDIQASMCVPLYGTEDVLGLIYVEAKAEPTSFTVEHLHFLTMLGQVVGTAVEDAQLYEENVEKERLAAIGQAVAGINHYFKNVITGISCGVEMIESAVEEQDMARVASASKIVRKSVTRMEEMTRDVLSHVRRVELSMKECSVNGLVHDIIESLEGRAADSNVELVFNEIPLEPATFDIQHIYRALLNLSLNAIEACEDGPGTVEIRAHQEDGATYISVRDTGMGIPRENIPKLAEPFFTTKGARGTGLGLATTFRLVELHGGTITVESTLGEGSQFMLMLPAHIEKQNSTQEMTPLQVKS